LRGAKHYRRNLHAFKGVCAKPKGPDTGITSWQLFEMWVKERKPAAGTVENWRYMLRALNDDFEGRSAGFNSARGSGNQPSERAQQRR
jgi:hypothetical protein